ALDRDEGGGRYAERAEQALLDEAVLCGLDRARGRIDRRVPGGGLERGRRHVLDLDRQRVDLPRERFDGRNVAELGGHEPCDLCTRRIGAAIEQHALDAERMAREREHSAELPGPDDADRRQLHSDSRGSGFSSTAAVCCLRKRSSSAAMLSCLFARIAQAKRAALIAPGRPIASVPTGTPAGICAIDSSESMPFKAFERIGTPSTGRLVFAAVMPGRCAAPPAPAMMTSMPRDAAVDAYSKSRSGVRCADTTRTSCGTPSDSRVSAA